MTTVTRPKRDWAALDAAHRRRGQLAFTLILDPAALLPPRQPAVRLGRPQRYSDALIEAAVMLRVALKLPYRALEGLMRAVFDGAGLAHRSVPDHTLVCRRQAQLAPRLPRLKAGRDACYLVDSTGLKVSGQGEWLVRAHGASQRRGWVKLHILTDAGSGEIVSVEVTSDRAGDSPTLPALLAPHELTKATVIGDGAYDSQRCYRAAHAKGARMLAPPKTGARRWALREPAFKGRNAAVADIRDIGKPLWKRQEGYHRRSRVESSMNRIKRLTGDRALSRTEARVRVECVLRARWLNALIPSAAGAKA